jgi:hypothetical protein
VKPGARYIVIEGARRLTGKRKSEIALSAGFDDMNLTRAAPA